MSRRNSAKSNANRLWANPVRTLIGLWLLAGIAITLMGPFGTFTILRVHERLAFWSAVIGSAILLVVALRLMVLQIIGPGRHPFVLDAILLPTFTLLYAPPLHYFVVRAARDAQPFNVLQTGLIVIGVSLLLIAIREALRLHAPGVDPDPTMDEILEEGGVHPILLERLPEDQRGELLAISGSDHYVEVRTMRGMTSVLLRFSDAMREIDGVPGQRVHRSHWVADAAAMHVRRDGNRHYVVLRTGEELPVSRTYAERAFERWGAALTGVSGQ